MGQGLSTSGGRFQSASADHNDFDDSASFGDLPLSPLAGPSPRSAARMQAFTPASAPKQSSVGIKGMSPPAGEQSFADEDVPLEASANTFDGSASFDRATPPAAKSLPSAAPKSVAKSAVKAAAKPVAKQPAASSLMADLGLDDDDP